MAVPQALFEKGLWAAVARLAWAKPHDTQLVMWVKEVAALVQGSARACRGRGVGVE